MSSLKTKLRKLLGQKHSLPRLVIGVFIAHIIALLLVTHSQPRAKKKVAKKIAVNTRVVKEAPPQKSAPKALPKATPKPAPKQAAKPAPNPKPVAKPVAKQAPKPKPKPAPKQPAVDRQLLSDLDSQFSKVEQALKKREETKPFVPEAPVFEETPMIAELNITPSETIDSHIEYAQILSGYLRDLLKLPSKGKVKVKLTVAANGGVVGVVPIQIESQKNWEYLENVLKQITLPVHDDSSPKQMTITFCENK